MLAVTTNKIGNPEAQDQSAVNGQMELNVVRVLPVGTPFTTDNHEVFAVVNGELASVGYVPGWRPHSA